MAGCDGQRDKAEDHRPDHEGRPDRTAEGILRQILQRIQREHGSGDIYQLFPEWDQTGSEDRRTIRAEEATGKKPKFLVQTGDGILEITKLQLQGKKAMAAADFLRGVRQIPEKLGVINDLV